MAYGLIFDMDGVLADTEPLIAEASIRTFRELYGLELTAEDFRPFVGTGAVRYVQGPAETIGFEIDLEEVLALRIAHFERLLWTTDHLALPGVLDLIASAHASADWRLAIATSSPDRKARVTLEAAKVPLGKFDAFIHGDLVARKKPDPEIYLAAATALSIPTDRCVAIEDAVEGVKSAKAAGMKCVGVTNTFSSDELREADLCVASLADVTLERLRQLLS